jgi:hypothetical protein
MRLAPVPISMRLRAGVTAWPAGDQAPGDQQDHVDDGGPRLPRLDVVHRRHRVPGERLSCHDVTLDRQI